MGTIQDITRMFAERPDANLEEVFFRATADAPPPIPDAPPVIGDGR
jgi:hypothetical protein